MTEFRPLHRIADDIVKHWRKPHFSAVPYLNAMRYLATLDESYGHEDAESVVRRFLNESATWRGEDARRVKAELRAMLAAHLRGELRPVENTRPL